MNWDESQIVPSLHHRKEGTSARFQFVHTFIARRNSLSNFDPHPTLSQRERDLY